MSDSAELFLQYVRPHWRRLHAVAGGYLAHPDDARDLVQETLLRAWRAFAPTDDRTYARGWLFVIMRNVVIDWRRSLARKVRLVPVELDELTEIAAADPCEPFSPLPAESGIHRSVEVTTPQQQNISRFLDVPATMEAYEQADFTPRRPGISPKCAWTSATPSRRAM